MCVLVPKPDMASSPGLQFFRYLPEADYHGAMNEGRSLKERGVNLKRCSRCPLLRPETFCQLVVRPGQDPFLEKPFFVLRRLICTNSFNELVTGIRLKVESHFGIAETHALHDKEPERQASSKFSSWVSNSATRISESCGDVLHFAPSLVARASRSHSPRVHGLVTLWAWTISVDNKSLDILFVGPSTQVRFFS